MAVFALFQLVHANINDMKELIDLNFDDETMDHDPEY